MRLGLPILVPAMVVAISGWFSVHPTRAQDKGAETAVRASAEQLVKSFNAGKVEELAALFLPQGEFIDEEGKLYKGRKELTQLFSQFFERFPGAKVTLEVESIRLIGSGLAIEEGTRHIVAGSKDAPARADLRYTAVRSQVDGKWLIASLREFTADPAPTPREQLEPLAWLVGDWVNEGTDGVVRISYRWDEDNNYLLGEYRVMIEGKLALKSSQRVGWNPLAGKIRSWLFDSDGGYSQGDWTLVDDGWVIKSSSVNPDGSTGTATITMTPKDKDHFTMKGTDRIVGDQRESDFDVAVARRPPTASK